MGKVDTILRDRGDEGDVLFWYLDIAVDQTRSMMPTPGPSVRDQRVLRASPQHA
jgi:hypothetical protein